MWIGFVAPQCSLDVFFVCSQSDCCLFFSTLFPLFLSSRVVSSQQHQTTHKTKQVLRVWMHLSGSRQQQPRQTSSTHQRPWSCQCQRFQTLLWPRPHLRCVGSWLTCVFCVCSVEQEGCSVRLKAAAQTCNALAETNLGCLFSWLACCCPPDTPHR